MPSPLHDQLVAAGATLGDYSGAETALHFASGAEEEFRKLTTEAAVYDLNWRAKIAVTGEDRVRWMNGMVTNNVRDLPIGHGNYNFLLNAKGQILADFYIYNRGESLWIDTERSQLPKIMQTLDHFIIMDDVELTDISEKVASLAVQGPNAKQVIQAAGIPLPNGPLQYSDVTWRGIGITVTQMASPDFLTYEIWSGAENFGQLWTALIESGAVPVGTRALEMFRVMSGVPKYDQDIRERDLPQETAQEHALNFTKGCYIGQEIVERIRSRGAVHRTFTGFIATSGEPTSGTKLSADGKENVGVITSVEHVPTKTLGTRTLCLGYLRRELIERGSKITFEGGSVEPHALPFTNA
ncbi:MAG: folate-binding protein [Acidobacteriaceae bacterium]